jgi:archaellum component FlaF (FlaF/FlaG flagellin family)
MKTKQTAKLISVVLIIATNQVLATDLTIARSGSQVVLSWPQASTNDFYLQAATNLSAPLAWNNATDPATNGSTLVITNQTASTSSFYRLKAWEVLFDGTNVTAFRAFPTNVANLFPSNSWVVTNGTLATKVVANLTNLITKTA